MNFLVSNDDGYNSPNLKILVDELSKYGTVYVSAPLNERSGASLSITLGKIVPYYRIDERIIAVDGTPVDSLLKGLTHFRVNFDLIFSGINNGYNLSTETLYSGTLGLSLEAYHQGYNVIALSARYGEELDSIREKTKFILKYIFDNKIYLKSRLFSINYPNIYSKWQKEVKLSKTEDIKFEYPSFIKDHKDDKDIDRYQIEHGFFSITPLKDSFLDIETYNKMKNVD